MRFFKDNKGKIISLIVILVVLAFAYNLGGSPKKKSEKPEKPNVQTEISVLAENEKAESEDKSTVSEKEEKAEEESLSKDEENPAEEKLQEKEITGKGLPAEEEKIKPEKEKSSEPVMEKETEAVEKEVPKPADEKHPAPIEPQTVTISDKELQCTISIRCDNIIENLDKLEESKWQLIPENGIILAEKTVTFYEGETVFNVLLRETRRNGIHMEYVNTPIYNSAYIEGIHNLYEFDCGELSGWMYSVNGWFPNYGCSRYALKDGDRIEWVYTCELGEDVKQK